MQLRSALLAATVLATPIAASAQPVTGLYVGAGAGVNITQQENIKRLSVWACRRCQADRCRPTATSTAAPGSPASSSSAGASATGCGPKSRATTATTTATASPTAIRQLRRWRRYHRAEVRRHGQRAVRLQRPVALVRAIYRCRRWLRRHQREWHVDNNLGVHCAGAASSVAAFKRFGQGPARSTADSTKGSFAYQAILGAAFPIAADRAWIWQFTAEYRFLGTTGNRSYNGTCGRGQHRRHRHSRLRPAFSWVRPTTTRSWSACATTSA